MDETLDTLATELRIALATDAEVESRTRHEWTESKLHVIDLLCRARRKFGENEQFGAWLARNELDHLSKDDRAAAINLGQDLDLCQAVLLDSDSTSLRLIWVKNKWRYTVTPEGQNDQFDVRSDAKIKSSGKASSAALAVTQQRKGGGSKLIQKFGEAGRILISHYGRKTRTTARLVDKLNTQQARKLADFITSTPGLPPPPNSKADLGLATLWGNAPNALIQKYRLGRSEAGALMAVVDDWKISVAPVLANWNAAGAPDDSNTWYARVIPAPVAAAQAAAVQAEADAAISRTVTAMIEAVPEPKIDPSCRAAFKGPIRHHGADIWPAPPGHRYSFDDAWYVATIWCLIDRWLARAEPNPKTRAAGFMKLLIGCMRNLNPAAGEIMAIILWAQDANPHLTSEEDNVCPPYDSLQ